MYQGRYIRGGENLRDLGRAFQGEGTACAKPGDRSTWAQAGKSVCVSQPANSESASACLCRITLPP